MKHYRLVGEGEKHFEIHDTRDNTRFHVAKKGIDKSFLGKIKGLQKFDVGGTVLDKRPENLEMPPQEPSELNAQETGLDVYQKALTPQTDFTSASPFGARSAANVTPQQREILAENAGAAAKNFKEEEQASLDAKTAQDAQDISARNDKRAALGLPLLPGAQSPSVTPASFQPSDQSPQVPQQQNATGLPQVPGSPYDKIIGQEENANKRIAQAQAEGYKAQAEAQNNFQKTYADVSNQYKTQLEQNTQKQNDLMTQIQSEKVDPNRYWNSKSTFGKVTSILGLILGGAGSGGDQRNNAASNALNQAIDRDIDAQKSNIDTKKSILGDYMKQYGNIAQAQLAAKSDLLAVTQSKLSQIMATTNSPVAVQQAKILNSNLELQRQQLNMQLSQRKVLFDLYNGSISDPQRLGTAINVMQAINPEAAKDLQEKFIPNVGLASVKVPDKPREEMIQRKSLQDQIEKLAAFAQQHGGSLSPEEQAYGHTLAKTVQDAYRRANGQGVFREAEAKFVNGIVDEDPTKFFGNIRTSPKYRALIDSNKVELNSLYQGYGIKQPAQVNFKPGFKVVGR